MSEETLLMLIDLRNKYYYNLFRSEDLVLVEAECIKCGKLTFITKSYGGMYPLCNHHKNREGARHG